MDDALFYEELPSVSAVYLVLDDARGRMAQICRFNYRLRQVFVHQVNPRPQTILGRTPLEIHA